MVSAESSEIPRSVVDEKASEHKVDVGPPSAGILTSQSWRGAVCVFCGSSTGNDPEFELAAQQVGKALAKHQYPLVYGGGTWGLMGAVAESTYEAGGRVLGIIPKALMSHERAVKSRAAKSESNGQGIHDPTSADEASENDRCIVSIVKTMHERKQEMARYAERGFVALPGGFGTFEEILEMTTWTQLRIHTLPVVLININNFYSPLRDMVKGAIDAGFIRKENGDIIIYVDKPTSASEGNAGSDFDWGEAALQALQAWHDKVPTTQQYDLSWK